MKNTRSTRQAAAKTTIWTRPATPAGKYRATLMPHGEGCDCLDCPRPFAHARLVEGPFQGARLVEGPFPHARLV